VTTGKGTLIGVRLLDVPLATLDAWILGQKEPDLSRPEAIRRLVELGLAGSRPPGRRSQEDTAKASDMAARHIDKLANQTLPEAEQRARKRRLIKGPKEFRDIRDEVRKSSRLKK
jgi:hypothetical protein